jgi:hypothetical protein
MLSCTLVTLDSWTVTPRRSPAGQGCCPPWWPSDEADRYSSLPHAWLDPLVYQGLGTANPQFQLYSTWEQAVNDLMKGLARLRGLLGPPAEGKECVRADSPTSRVVAKPHPERGCRRADGSGNRVQQASPERRRQPITKKRKSAEGPTARRLQSRTASLSGKAPPAVAGGWAWQAG